MKKKKVPVGIWKRYEAYHFEVAPSLIASSHSFSFKRFDVEIRLPAKPKQKDWKNMELPVTCWSYKTRNNRRTPLSYHIHQIDAVIRTGTGRKVREEAIGKVNGRLFSSRERQSLDKLTYKYEKILDEAFEHWINVLRWCTEKPTICQLSHQRQGTTWGAYLIDAESTQRFYAPPHILTAQMANPISKVEWNRAEAILRKGKNVPIWQIYYAEAFERLNLGDQRGYIISLAISSETAIRHISKSFLKEPINTKYQSIINTIPISRLINNWKKLGFDSSEWISLESERKSISKLFEVRNGIMHRGESPDISKQERDSFGLSVKKFIKMIEKNG